MKRDGWKRKDQEVDRRGDGDADDQGDNMKEDGK